MLQPTRLLLLHRPNGGRTAFPNLTESLAKTEIDIDWMIVPVPPHDSGSFSRC